MALPNEIPRSFRLYVTHVAGEGHFLKISGQLDQPSCLMIESLFEAARENLEKGIGAVHPAAIQQGVICAAKYKDGTYYRAKIINTTNLASGLVEVHFIDYGNKDIISLSTIRFLDNYDPMFLQLRGQASDYYLSRIMHPSGRWEEPLLLKLQSLLCYAEYSANIEATTRTLPIIAIQFKGNDLSSHLVANRFGISIPVPKQEVLLMQIAAGENQSMSNWQPTFVNEPPSSYSEHVPFLMNQNFLSNPASAMRLQQNVSLPYNGSVPPPSLVSQRLLVNKVARNPVNLKPSRQPQQVTTMAPSIINTPPPAPVNNKPPSPKKSATYKSSRLLEVGSQHKVFVIAEEGPELFAVQLVTDAKRLQDMMEEINRRPHSSLTEPPMIGTVCLGRMTGDRIICRAVVQNLSGSQCKLFFVDFGDTEVVSYYDIFDIPEEFVKPHVFAMRFCLSGVKQLEKGPYLNEAFKNLVNGKVLTLRVVAPEGPPLIQYGELYLDNTSVLDILLANMKDKLQFKWMEMLPLGSKKSVLVSYVDSCLKFYVQLSEKIEELEAVMDAVKTHCENSSPPGDLPVGAACCARFPDDDNWYRARIKEKQGNKVIVAYVDYGNEQEVNVSDLRTITPELIRLPAQALKCALKGYENKPVETKTSNQLEMLALEKTLMAHVVGVLSTDTMLVTLVDDTVSPPLDVARRMTQLSQPRSSVDPKATTPVRKDAPESFSSPEGSEDSRKKSFRREKSFKDERRPREGNEDFGQRGSSFRARENKEPFDRSGPGRQSDKYAARSDFKPDRGDRRGGFKPRENIASPPAPVTAGDDEWEESPSGSQQTFQSPPRPRENNRRHPREQQGNRPNWKGKDGGVGKRLRQATEAVSHDTQNKGFSVQDRLKRDRFNYANENKNDEWGNKSERPDRRDNSDRPDRRDNSDRWNNSERPDRRDNSDRRNNSERPDRRENNDRQDRWNNGERPERRDNSDRQDRWNNSDRPERRDNRGDRRDNYGERKEFQKREFRDNHRERGDRTKSNFTPRDRAERSFGSDGDKKSENSYKSNENGGRAGRAPPYKPRSKFTQVQYKELPDPIPLESTFQEPVVDSGAQHEVAVTWIISPESFYTQILSLQPKFLEMMHTIPELYKGVKSYTGIVPVGASVLARYPADGVLYRATVVSVQPFSKFIVRYVDFGNKQLVDAKDIWQLDRQLIELPKMAVHCSLLGVAPKDGEWKASPEVDLCFNAPRYQCVFQEFADEQWKVSLWNNGASVADMLVEKQLAVMSEHQSSVALKDEAIDLTIIVGQQILCKVTHVESYEKFYVQLDIEKAVLVENAIANFDATKLTPLAADSLTDGVHCTVRHEDKIYRAILEDVSDTENIRAVLPDYGFTITTSLANLMILPTELSVYYYQSLMCTLNNYTADSKTLMTVEEMKQRLVNNKFIIYINNVEGISLVSTLYDMVTGQKIAIFEPDEGAYEEVIQLCARAVFNYNFGMAYISHSESLNEIYLQKSTDSDNIAQLLEELYKFYEEGNPEPMTSFEQDELCVAKSSDGNWYRATIASAEENEVKVQFSDYGNSETVPKETVKKIDPKFFEPCAQALVAGLNLVALQDDALAKLMEWTTDKEVQVTLAFGSDGWLASLHLDGVDLSMKLVNEKLATPQVGSVEEHKIEETPAEEPISLPPGCTQVYISHIDTPGHFWLQMSDKVDKIEEIQAELQANANSYPDIESREMSTLCIAKYLADDQWYRAEILDADSDITTVRFTDYGNTDVLDNQPGLIKAIPDHLKEIERYALKSSVNAIPTGTGEWSEAASEYFTQLVGDLSAPVDALIVLKDVTTYVDLFVNGQNLTDKLVSEGHATKSEENEYGDLPSCFASHVNSPSEFWIQLESSTSELQTMENAMVDAENFPELTEKLEGVICAAKYPEDGAWYRAQVIVDGSEGTEVLFMDYGNASIANELRSLPDELKVKPALSRKCALQKPRDIKSWSRKSEIKFNELAAEGATIFNVQFIASGDISIVELYLEGKSVTEELVDLCEDHPPIERPAPVGQDLRCSGKICQVNSVDEFYVQLDDKVADIDRITDQLSNAAELEQPEELKVGSLCAGFWDEDEQWYRAKILEFCDGGYHVLFIDYGNKAKCQDFRKLSEDLSVIEPAAKCCRLAGLEDNSTVKEMAKRKLDDLAADASLTFQIEFLDSTKEPALVKLFLDGTDVVSMITTNETTMQDEGDSKPNEIAEPVIESTQIFSETITDTATIAAVPESKDLNVEDEQNIEKLETEINNEISMSIEDNKHKSNESVEPGIESTQMFTEKVTNIDTIAVVPKSKDLNVGDKQNIEKLETEINNEISMSIEDNKQKAEVDIQIEKEPIGSDQADECADEENTSQTDLNESAESSNTVIENKSFEGIADSSSEEILDDTPVSSDKNESSETIENSNETIKTPERDDSKDSFNTDTGYTSGGDHEKLSPIKDEITASTKEIESPEVESTPIPEMESPKNGTQKHETESPKKEAVTQETESPEREILAHETESHKNEHLIQSTELPKKEITSELVTNETKTSDNVQVKTVVTVDSPKIDVNKETVESGVE